MTFSSRVALILFLVAGCVNRTEIAQNGDAAMLPDGTAPDAGPGVDTGLDAGSLPDAPDPSGEWARSFGGEASDLPTDVALDDAGNVYVAGILSGPAVIGTETVAGGSRAGFVASYTSAGMFRWVESLGARSQTIGNRVHLAVEGSVVVAAMDFIGTATRDEGTLTSVGDQPDLLLASFTTGGEFRWWQREGGVNEERVSGVALDAGGNAYLAGYFHEATEIGGNALTGVRGTGYVVSFDSSGALRWTRTPGVRASAPIGGLTLEGDELVLIGGFGGFGVAPTDFDLGGTVISGEFGDTYIFALSTENEVRWARQATSGGGMEIWTMVRSPAGVTYVAAGLRGFATLGSIELRPSGTYDAVVMAFDDEGAGLWANVYGSEDIAPIDRATGISFDGSGVAVTGQFAGSIDLGGGLLDPTPFMSGHNTFVLLLDASGNHVWSTAFDNSAQDGQVSTVVASSEGHLFVATPFTRDPTFGGTVLNAAGFEDGAVIRVHPAR